VTVGRDLSTNLGAYLELVSLTSRAESVPDTGSLDGGITYAVTPNVQLDAGSNFGLTRSSDDWTGFVGLSVRI